MRLLEVETATPPLDLYLNKRVVEFEQRLESTGKSGIISAACNRVAIRLQRHRKRRRRHATVPPTLQRPSLEFGPGRTAWARTWCVDTDPESKLQAQWEQRWLQRTSDPPDYRRAPAPASQQPVFTLKALKKHRHLLKHESSLLTQIRTGKIGLRAFLFERRVPEATTPRCSCGEAPETAAHLVLSCQQLDQQREDLQMLLYPKALRSYRDFVNATAEGGSARTLVRWLLATGRFPEFRLAERYRAGEVQVQD